jgi:hypothetical protein
MVQFDQCMHGLVHPCVPPPGVPRSRIRKATRLLSNLQDLRVLEARCSGRHSHERWGGQSK